MVEAPTDTPVEDDVEASGADTGTDTGTDTDPTFEQPDVDRTPERLLDELDDLPLDEHPTAFAAIDEALTSELGSLDDPD